MTTPYCSRYAIDKPAFSAYTVHVKLDEFGMPIDGPFKKEKYVRPGEIYERKTKVGRYEVSSIHLGTMGGGAYEYETMIFDDVTGDTDVRPEFSTRHQTAEEAEHWHAEVVGKLQTEIDALKIVRRSNDT